jgi:hypothetical protein
LRCYNRDLMIPGELKQLVQLAGVFGLLAAVIGIGYLANWWMDRAFPARSYTQRVCQDAYRYDTRYETDVSYVDVPLTEGCFSGTVLLPAQWKTWNLQFTGSSDRAHWMSVWYGGMPAPAGPFLESQVNAGMTAGPRRDMRFQGKGTLRLSRLTEDPEIVVKQLIAKAEQQDESPSTGLTDPTVVADSEFSMQLAGCHRQGDAIGCWGYVKNRTHVPGTVDLCDSIVVDDQGRSFSIGTDGGIRFAKGLGETLMPGMSARFFIRIPDPNRKVSTLHLDLPLLIAGENRTIHYIFGDVGLK